MVAGATSPRGRPTEFSPEKQRLIVEAVANGNYYEAACQRARVHYSTFMRWMRWGESSSPSRQAFRQFRMAVLEAEAESEAKVVALWQAQIPDEWRAARDFLARRYPDRWGPKQRQEVSGPGGEPLSLRVVEQIVTSRNGSPADERPESPDHPTA